MDQKKREKITVTMKKFHDLSRFQDFKLEFVFIQNKCLPKSACFQTLKIWDMIAVKITITTKSVYNQTIKYTNKHTVSLNIRTAASQTSNQQILFQKFVCLNTI